MFDSLTTAHPADRAAEWRPGVPAEGAAPHGEVFAPGREATGAAMALALACDRLRLAGAAPRPWLWVQDTGALKLGGRPYLPGLPPALRHGMIHVAAKTAQDALFALEQGLCCRDLGFVIGELAGNPRALDFTASRRLSLAAERHGVPLWLVRLDARHDLGSARMRWDARAAASPAPRWNAEAPGAACWRAELFRARRHPPGKWILRDDADALVAVPVPGRSAATPHPGDLAAAAGDRPLAAV